MASQPLRPGDPDHLGEYRLEARLGTGGMGTVFLGRTEQDRKVAVKVVRSEYISDGEFLRRFRSEVDRARQVPPFCTAEVLDADLDHEPPYLVVEFVDGPTLTGVVRERGPLSPAALHSAAVGIATALAAIHGAGVIHRDLKPDNVLFALGGLKVIDFGIARPLEATSRHTRTDQMIGTVAYMAPERFDEQTAGRVGPAADVFAWGAVVAFAATGRTPFQGESASATAMRILTRPPEIDGLPDALRPIVARALAKEPADRPTARELLDLLLADGRPAPAVLPVPDDPAPVAAGPPPAPVPLRPGGPAGPAGDQPVKRGRGLTVALAALVVLGILAGGGWALARTGGGPQDRAGQATGPGPSGTGPSAAPSAVRTGTPGILAGERRTLIHFVEIDRELAMPFRDEVKTSDGTGKDALFNLIPAGVDFLIQAVRPEESEDLCLGVKIRSDGYAELVATACTATKATLFSIVATGDKDDKGRPTFTISNDEHGFVQYWEEKSQVYVEHNGDAPPADTFSFVDRGAV